MKKHRHETYLWELNLKEMFKWIKEIRSFHQFIPTAANTYCISTKYIGDYQRMQFEKFLAEFYETKKRRHQFICFWRETEVVVTVFKQI